MERNGRSKDTSEPVAGRIWAAWNVARYFLHSPERAAAYWSGALSPGDRLVSMTHEERDDVLLSASVRIMAIPRRRHVRAYRFRVVRAGWLGQVVLFLRIATFPRLPRSGMPPNVRRSRAFEHERP